MSFFSVAAVVAGLHNLYEFLRELSGTAEKGGIELYAVLMLLGGLLAISGAVLMFMNKKSAAFLLIGAAVVSVCENIFGLEPFFPFLWTFFYVMASAGCFYQINLGMKIPSYGFIRTRRELIEKTIDELSDSEKIMRHQTDWAKSVNAFMKNYGVLTYYVFLVLEIFCMAVPIIYFYKFFEHLQAENIFPEASKWTLILSAIAVAGTEFQRRHLADDD